MKLHVEGRWTGIRVKLHTEGHVDRNTGEITYSEFTGQRKRQVVLSLEVDAERQAGRNTI